jgi:hypothetical protein
VTTTWVPVAVVLVVVVLDLWVFLDARRCAREGAPVELRIGTFAVNTPVAWFLACLVLWIFFFPVYVVSRSR